MEFDSILPQLGEVAAKAGAAEEASDAPKPVVVGKVAGATRKMVFLATLVVAAWAYMSYVIIEQGDTIRSQNYLIFQLFQDSKQLTSLKGQIAQKRAQELANAAPSAPNAAKPAPVPQGTSDCKDCKTTTRRPQDRPPQQAADKLDTRRMLMAI